MKRGEATVRHGFGFSPVLIAGTVPPLTQHIERSRRELEALRSVAIAGRWSEVFVACQDVRFS